MNIINKIANYFKQKDNELKKQKEQERINGYVNSSGIKGTGKLIGLKCPYCAIKLFENPKSSKTLYNTSELFYQDVDFINHVVQKHSIDFNAAIVVWNFYYLNKKLKEYNIEI